MINFLLGFVSGIVLSMLIIYLELIWPQRKSRPAIKQSHRLQESERPTQEKVNEGIGRIIKYWEEKNADKSG